MDLRLKDRVFIVTGATRGLGRATAQVLVDEGAKVVLSSRHQDSVEAAVAELGSECAVGLAADNADPTSARRLVEAAQSAYGRLDGALISVGGPPVGGVLDVTDAQWSSSFEAVFLGAVRLAREVTGALERGGSVAFILSTSVKQPIGGLAISNGLRPGLAMAAKTLADEVGPRGIRVNGLLPGRVETERVQELDAAADDPDAVRRHHESLIPLRRYGKPEEFGRAAAFLLSPASAYINGVMLPVDGGLSRGL
ncbi:MAG: SDR family oxidoreductase [Propionibacteriales bacterium]|nr:SDR family oxidoreductase [Propionibacteriales bacterium]